MLLPEWKIIKHNVYDNTYLCSDREMRTEEELYSMIKIYNNALLHDLQFKEVFIPDERHYGGIRCEWFFQRTDLNPHKG